MGYSKAVEMEMEMGMEMASAECNYQSGRFAQAASILEKCENNNDLQSDHTNNKSSDPSNNGSKNGNRLGMNNEKSNENSAIHPSDNAHIDNNNDIIIYDESSESDNRTTSDTRFPRHKNSIAKKPNSTTTRIEFLALPSSARRADIAMCRFRSALSSPTSSPTSSLWQQAVRSNQSYRMALRGAAISLTDTCREIYHAMKNKYLHCDGDVRSVQIAIRETSVAILMAGVSASFLYLHSCRLENQERDNHHDQQQQQQQQREKKLQSGQNAPSQQHDSNASKSWKVLVDAAILAVELVSFRENFMEDVKSIDEMDNNDHSEEASKKKEEQREKNNHPPKTAKESLTPERLSPLEEALDILNKSLLNRHENYSESKNAINGDCEREEVALHSFRTALKVSALANDRLILSTLHDDCLESSSAFPAGSVKKKKAKTMSHDADVRLSKRQKAVSGAEKRDGSESVWDVKFSHHGDASLRSREHLVDALSYHVASVRYYDDNGNKGKDDSRHSNLYLTKKKAMIENRDKCFQEAEAWESRLLGTTTPVCHDADGMHDVEVGESGGYVGYAWKIKHCLHGLELASSLRFDTTLISLDETSPKSSIPKDKETFHALKQLARSSSSEFSRSLLGCIHALQGEFTSAVSSMQKVLDACERRNSTSDNDGAVRYADFDSDEEIDIGSVERRTVVNMAMCFTALGEVNTPVELLLHLLATDTDSSISNTGRHVIPTSMLLSADGYEKETLCYGSDIVKKKSIKFKLLWMLFHASSLAKEWATCLDSMEELNEMDLISGNASFHRDIALVFALLQCRRASTAHDITTKIIPKMISLAVLTPIGNEASPYESVSMRILLLLADLYSVDACLIQDNFSKNKYYDATSSTSISFSPCECTKRAVENIDFISSSNSDMMKYPTIKELRVAVLNDRGISLLMSGDSIGALGCFRDAVAMTSSNPSISWLALPAHFNLSLLLLRDGRIEESCKSWLRARGHLPTLESAMQGNNLDLQKLRDIRLLAINRHGLLMARRNFSGDGMVLEQENVMEWVPPNLVGDELKEDDNHHYGVDVSQITALDVVLLRFAVSYAEKTAARVFRKNGGGVF